MYELNTRVYRKGVQWIVLQGTFTINVLRKNPGAMDPLLGHAWSLFRCRFPKKEAIHSRRRILN